MNHTQNRHYTQNRHFGKSQKRKPESELRYLPRCLCLNMISADEVIGRVELYFNGGAIDYLTAEQAAAVAGVTGEK